MTGGMLLLALLGVMALSLYGLVLWYSGQAQREAAVTRSRLSEGERTRRRWRGVIEDRVRSTRLGRALQLRLHAAGVEWGLADLLAAQGGGVLAALLLGAVLGSAAAGILLAVAAVMVPLLWLDRQRSERRDQFISQLPDLARAMSGASSAGLSLRSALDLAAAELNEPAAAELTRVTEELRLGQPIEDALGNLQARMPSREVAVLVATLVVQHRAGGDLVDALRDMAFTLDQRKDLRREIRTLLSGTVSTGYVVALLGALSIAMVSIGSPQTIPSMLSSWTGRVVLAISAALYAVGFTLIARLTRIET